MQPQQPDQKIFVIDSDISDEDVTLPSLPVVDIPVIETPRIADRAAVPAPTALPAAQSATLAVNAPQITEPTQPAPFATSEQTQTSTESGGFFGRMKEGLSKSRKNFTEGMVNILIGGKEIDDELLEEVETQLLVADIGVEATRTIIQNLTARTERRELIYSNALYKALQEELVALLAPRVKPLHIDSNKAPFVILVVGVNGVGLL